MDLILDDVRSLLAGRFRIDPDAVQPGSNVRELAKADSLAILETIVAIEDHFGVEIPDALVLRLEHVADIADTVRHLQARHAHAS